jgi:hypothetical protein
VSKSSSSKKSSSVPTDQGRPIHRDDIEKGLRAIKDDIDSVKESASGLGVAAIIGGALLLVLLAFIIGRRRGKQKYAFVEVRRA